MIKYLGSVGFFIHLNDNEDKTYQLLNIFSSNSAQLSLFSSEINNSTGQITYTSPSVSCYVNGALGNSVAPNEWSHVTISFEDTLATYEENNFLIRFGDTASSNFNIQNLYIMQSNLSQQLVENLHHEFTGKRNSSVATVIDSASAALNIIDGDEEEFFSSATGKMYQKFNNQNRFLTEIQAVTNLTMSQFVSASIISNDNLFIDEVFLEENDKILSLFDNQIYEITASSQLQTLSSSVGDVVSITLGQQYGGTAFLKTQNGFILTPLTERVGVIKNIFETN